MTTRRIVTGHDATGKSVFLDDGDTPRTVSFQHVPGLKGSLVWEASADVGRVTQLADPTADAKWLPQKGNVTLMVITFPPDSVMMSPNFDPAAAGYEYVSLLPGLAERFERENPGMHQTDTTDYGIVLSGNPVLELDDGAVRSLAPGDCVVQQGTRHAWRNPTDASAVIAFTMIATN